MDQRRRASIGVSTVVPSSRASSRTRHEPTPFQTRNTTTGSPRDVRARLREQVANLAPGNERADAPLVSMSQQFFIALIVSGVLLMIAAVALRVFYM
jgi:hypothetical protein